MADTQLKQAFIYAFAEDAPPDVDVNLKEAFVTAFSEAPSDVQLKEVAIYGLVYETKYIPRIGPITLPCQNYCWPMFMFKGRIK